MALAQNRKKIKSLAHFLKYVKAWIITCVAIDYITTYSNRSPVYHSVNEFNKI